MERRGPMSDKEKGRGRTKIDVTCLLEMSRVFHAESAGGKADLEAQRATQVCFLLCALMCVCFHLFV